MMKNGTIKYHNDLPAVCDPWMRLWTKILLLAVFDLRGKRTNFIDRQEAEEFLKSPWVQHMAMDINKINLQEIWNETD